MSYKSKIDLMKANERIAELEAILRTVFARLMAPTHPTWSDATAARIERFLLADMISPALKGEPQ